MSESVNFQLPENLTISSVQGLHEELERLVDQSDHDKISFKAENVSRADTAGIQLLLAFIHSAKERKIDLTWEAPSEKLISAVEVLGLRDAFGLQ